MAQKKEREVAEDQEQVFKEMCLQILQLSASLRKFHVTNAIRELNLQGNNLEATTNPSKSKAPFS